MLFELDHALVHGRRRLCVRGELDLATAPRLAEALQQELDGEPASLVVDLSGTSFLDSSGARALVVAGRRARSVGATMQIVCPVGNRAVRRVLDLLHLHLLVPVVEQVEAP